MYTVSLTSPFRLVALLTLLSLLSLLAACDAGLTAPDADDALAKANPGKETICHLDKATDNFYRITVSARAVPAHMNHGDQPFDPSEIDGISCEPEEEGGATPPPPPEPTDTCPCFDAADLALIAPDPFEDFNHDISGGAEVVALWGGGAVTDIQVGYVCLGDCLNQTNLCQYRYAPSAIEISLAPTLEEAEACKALLLDEYASRVSGGTAPPCTGNQCP